MIQHQPETLALIVLIQIKQSLTASLILEKILKLDLRLRAADLSGSISGARKFVLIPRQAHSRNTDNGAIVSDGNSLAPVITPMNSVDLI